MFLHQSFHFHWHVPVASVWKSTFVSLEVPTILENEWVSSWIGNNEKRKMNFLIYHGSENLVCQHKTPRITHSDVAMINIFSESFPFKRLKEKKATTTKQKNQHPSKACFNDFVWRFFSLLIQCSYIVFFIWIMRTNSLRLVFIQFYYDCYCMYNKRVFNFISVTNFSNDENRENIMWKNKIVSTNSIFCHSPVKAETLFSIFYFFFHSTVSKWHQVRWRLLNCFYCSRCGCCCRWGWCCCFCAFYHLNLIPHKRKRATKAVNKPKALDIGLGRVMYAMNGTNSCQANTVIISHVISIWIQRQYVISLICLKLNVVHLTLWFIELQ